MLDFRPTSWRITANHAPCPAATVRPQSAYDASHSRMTRPPCACLISQHISVQFGPPLSHNLATVHAIQQLTCMLLCLASARPLASRPRAHCASVLRVTVYATHVHSSARCLVLLVPMPQRAPCCHAPANAPSLLCFRAHHKHAHILPRLDTRPQAKPCSWPS